MLASSTNHVFSYKIDPKKTIKRQQTSLFYVIFVIMLLFLASPLLGFCVSATTPVRRAQPQQTLCRYMSSLCITNIFTRCSSQLSKNTIKPSILPLLQQSRTITIVSRLGKRKTSKSVLKRFRRVRGGYLKRWRSGMVKKQRKKSSWRKFRLRGSILVKRKSQLRTLNKMMYKH